MGITCDSPADSFIVVVVVVVVVVVAFKLKYYRIRAFPMIAPVMTRGCIL